MSTKVICRTCGLHYLEDTGDPCPGLCARCFEAGLMAATAALQAEADDPRVPLRELVPRQAARLRALGVTDEHVGYFIGWGTDGVRGGWRKPA